MDPEYETYCLVDPDFYDTPYRGVSDESLYEVARRDVPAGWVRTALDDCKPMTLGSGALPSVFFAAFYLDYLR